MVITNNINVANRMRVYPSIEVVIAGGVVRGSDGGIVGEAAVDFIKQFKVDYAVIGASAIDHDGALLDFDFREVKVAQAIIANARHVILVSDSTKFERTAPVRIGASLSQVDTFITDRCDIAAVQRICRDAEVELIETTRRAQACELAPGRNADNISFDIRSGFEIIPQRFRKCIKMLHCESAGGTVGCNPRSMTSSSSAAASTAAASRATRSAAAIPSTSPR